MPYNDEIVDPIPYRVRYLSWAARLIGRHSDLITASYIRSVHDVDSLRGDPFPVPPQPTGVALRAGMLRLDERLW